jgi:hypothetical protein
MLLRLLLLPQKKNTSPYAEKVILNLEAKVHLPFMNRVCISSNNIRQKRGRRIVCCSRREWWPCGGGCVVSGASGEALLGYR